MRDRGSHAGCSGERRLPACPFRQLAEKNAVGFPAPVLDATHWELSSASSRRLQASSLRSPNPESFAVIF